jgi:hypothetical protein
MTVTTASDPAVAGHRELYTVSIGNVSTQAIDGVNIVMQVPVGLSFVYNNDAYPQSAGCFTCNGNTQPSWNLGSIPAGQTQTVVINMTVDATVVEGASLSVPVTLRATGLLNPILATKTLQVHAAPSAQLAFGTVSNPVTPGQAFTLDVDIGQIGSAAITGTTVTAVLPTGLTAGAISNGGVQSTPGQIVWTIGSMAVGQLAHRTVTVTADAGVAPGSVLAARAMLSYDGGLAVDGTAEHVVSVIGVATPLSLTVSEVTSPAVPGARARYRIQISNHASRAVDGISLVLRTPLGLSHVYTTDANPQSAGCFTCVEGNEPYWNVGSLAAGDTYTISLNPTVVAAAVGDGSLIPANFTLTATGMNALFVQKTIQVFSLPGAQLVLGTQTGPLLAGQGLTYDLTVGQIGATALANATLSLVLPPGTTAGTISDGGTLAAGQVTWAVGGIPVGSYFHHTVAVTTNGTLPAGSILPARAWLTYDGGAEVDAVTEYAFPIVPAAQPLALSIATATTTAKAATPLMYTMTVTNSSARAVSGIYLYFRVPEGLSWVYTTDADPNSANCFTCVANNLPYWNLGMLAAGASQIVTLNGHVDATALNGSLVSGIVDLTATGLDALQTVTTTTPVQP